TNRLSLTTTTGAGLSLCSVTRRTHGASATSGAIRALYSSSKRRPLPDMVVPHILRCRKFAHNRAFLVHVVDNYIGVTQLGVLQNRRQNLKELAKRPHGLWSYVAQHHTQRPAGR